MKSSKLKTLAFAVLLISGISNIYAQVEDKLFEITPYLELKYFYWGEYNDQSNQVLEEYGNLYGGGLTGKTKFSRSFNLYAISEIDIYYGIVNYNGFLQDDLGNLHPYKSETAYLGLEFLINIGYDLKLGKHFIIAPEFGVQYEYWERDIDNGGQYGYSELWNLFLLDFGCNFIIPLPPSSKIFFKLFGEYPIVIEESIDLASRGHTGQANVNLEPGSNLGLNLELGAVIYGVFFSFYYDYLFFSKSPFDQNYQQPDSDRSIAGLKLGYSF